MNIDRYIELAEKWAEDLETTTEKQERRRLGDSIHGFCCLGRLCVAVGEAFNPYRAHPYESTEAYEVWQASARLLEFNPDEFTIMNDVYEHPFSVIAKYVRRAVGEARYRRDVFGKEEI